MAGLRPTQSRAEQHAGGVRCFTHADAGQLHRFHVGQGNGELLAGFARLSLQINARLGGAGRKTAPGLTAAKATAKRSRGSLLISFRLLQASSTQ